MVAGGPYKSQGRSRSDKALEIPIEMPSGALVNKPPRYPLELKKRRGNGEEFVSCQHTVYKCITHLVSPGTQPSGYISPEGVGGAEVVAAGARGRGIISHILITCLQNYCNVI